MERLELAGPIYAGMTRTNFDNECIRGVWEKKTAVRRLGQPIDIASGALFLASDEASFVTGHGLVIDGGQTLRMCPPDYCIAAIRFIISSSETSST